MRASRRAAPASLGALGALESGPAAVLRQVKAPGEPTSAMVDETADGRSQMHTPTRSSRSVGGSVMDTAKAARLCAQLGLPYGGLTGDYPPPALPLIAMPTTAGTGSEVSGGAVITDSQSGRKAGIAGANLRAQHALVDPLLTHSVPPAMTAYTGVDAPRAGDRRHRREMRHTDWRCDRARGDPPDRPLRCRAPTPTARTRAPAARWRAAA